MEPKGRAGKKQLGIGHGGFLVSVGFGNGVVGGDMMGKESEGPLTLHLSLSPSTEEKESRLNGGNVQPPFLITRSSMPQFPGFR